jgi:hypothetical protein
VKGISNAIATILMLMAPFGFVYSWYFYFTSMPWKSSGWRGRVTLASLVLISLAVLLWPVMMVLMPAADWVSGAGVGHQVQWVYARAGVASILLLAALLLGLFGRPRLILPIVVACIGAGLFWLFSTMP